MYLNLKFMVNVYEGLTQTRDAMGSLFFNNFEFTRGKYNWALVLEILFFQVIPPGFVFMCRFFFHCADCIVLLPIDYVIALDMAVNEPFNVAIIGHSLVCSSNGDLCAFLPIGQPRFG